MSDAQPVRRKGITLGVPRRMSPDEIAAEEARIIEENFPKHRSLHLKPNGGTVQKGERVEIVVTEEVLLATAHHVAQDTSKESGGFLLGNRYVCPNTNLEYIVIDQFMKADYTEGTQVSLTFTTDSWAQLKDRLDGKYRGKSLVGWYHSHPGMGIFLSNYDVDIHKNRFANEWDVALVLDPIKHEGGFFAWVDGNVNPREKLDFYELLDGDSRETVVAWTNYTAQDPKTGVAAALKTVNTQNSDGSPATPAANTPKTQAAAASSSLLSNPYLLIGGAAVLAMLLLGTVFAGYWLYSKRFGNPTNSSTVENPTVNNKVLNGEKIRLGKDLKGFVSSNNKMTVEMQITGIGGADIMEEIRKDNNLQIEINGQASTIEETQIINGAVLKVTAVSALTPEQAETFNTDKPQDFTMNVDIFYNGDVVSKKIETKFQKGKGTNPKPELGNLVAFGDVIEKNVAPKKVTPKSVVTDSSTDQPKQEDRSDKTQTKPKTTSSKNTKNNEQKNPNERESLEQRANTAATTTRERISNTNKKVTDAIKKEKDKIQ